MKERTIVYSSQQNHENRFPLSLFFMYFGILLLMSGIHIGLIVFMNTYHWNKLIQILIPSAYWFMVAYILTKYTRRKIIETYDVPMKNLADATKKVANGDFSVYVPTVHTEDKQDYLDVMILDFNKMVEELGSIETLKTDFISNVSHEIKTPLSVVSNYAQLLKNPSNTKEQYEEYANSILDASRRLSNLIQNILKLNKLENQTIQPQPETYDLCEQLCESVFQFESLWEKNNIDFSAELEEKALIYADEELMELVWTNLLSNATKFTSNGGSIAILQKTEDDSILVSVQDTGCGMNSDTKKRIFEKFYQGDTSHSTKGNGLGLALVKRILDLNGMSIHVESEEGKGSIFTVKIPRRDR